MDKIEKVKVNEEEIARQLPSIFRKLDWLEKEDIIKRIVSLEFNRLIDYYQNAEEIEEPSERSSRKEFGQGEKRERRNDRDKSSRTAEKGYTRIFINIGKTDGANPANLMGFVNDHVQGKVRIGRIDLLQNFSFFEVPEDSAQRVVKAFKGLFVDERKLVVEIAQDSPSEKKSDGQAKFFKNNDKKNRKGFRR